MAWARPTGLTLAFGLANAGLAALLVVGVFVGLPVRWWVVDVSAVVLAVALLGGSAGLLATTRWRWLALRISASLLLATGLSALAAIVLAASFLCGIFGSLGPQSTQFLFFAIALELPYLVAYPLLQLLWVRRQGQPSQPS